MVLERSTWQEVRDAGTEQVCLIPTGSIEQHGPHLPLATDTILSTSVAALAEAARPEKTLLFPGIFLGCSSHHMGYAGSLTASFETYAAVLREVVECAIHHGFKKFFVLNGHGGNTEPNGTTLRGLKDLNPNLTFAHAGYFSFIEQSVLDQLVGPIKGIRHSCEAEVSMMMHLRPDLVRSERRRDDGLNMEPPPPVGLTYIQPFDEITDEGSFGFATLATPNMGKSLIAAAAEGVANAIDHIHAGYVMVGRSS